MSIFTRVFLLVCCLSACLIHGALPNTSKQPYSKIKTVFMGCSNAGKTSLAYRIMKGHSLHPRDATPTIGAAFGSCKIADSKGRSGSLEIWDTAGQERYAAMLPMYTRAARLVFYVYDLTDRESFEATKCIIQDTLSALENDCYVVLLGNKLDVVLDDPEFRAVEAEEGRHLVKALSLNAFFEVSSWGDDEKLGFDSMRKSVIEEVIDRAYSYIPLSSIDPTASLSEDMLERFKNGPNGAPFRLDQPHAQQSGSSCSGCALM